jgi:hypothetical protein
MIRRLPMSWSTKYNVLLMRDNSTVLRFRMSSAWLKLGLAGAGLLLLLGLGGAYIGVRYYAESLIIKRERMALLERIGEMEEQIHRLENVESILSAVEKEDLRFLTPTVNLSRPSQTSLPLDLKELFSRIDLNILSVDNVQAKFLEEGMRVSYDLNSLQSSGTVAGTAWFALLNRAGIMIEVTDSGQESLFEISRFKPVKSIMALPQDLDREDIFALRMRITDTEGRVIFSETYPLAHILS